MSQTSEKKTQTSKKNSQSKVIRLKIVKKSKKESEKKSQTCKKVTKTDKLV